SGLSALQDSFFRPLMPILSPAEIFTLPTEKPSPPTQAPAALPQLPADPRAEESLTTLINTIVPASDKLELKERLGGIANPPRIVAETAAPIPVGTVKTFWGSNVDTDEQFQADLEMVYATDHVYFWVEKGVDFEMGDVRDLVDEFESKVYPTNREFFGSEWTPGVDGDPHLYMAYMTGLGDSVAGYFSSNDSLSRAVNKYSNEHEMFFLNADTLPLDAPYAHSTLAHEFQHMIHANLDPNEESWVNEGFSELATFINGYDPGGADYYFVQNMDLPLTFWPPDTDLAHYGQAFLVMAYFMDRFGSDATQALVAQQANGLDSIDKALTQAGEVDPETGQPLRAEDFLLDWAVATLLQDGSVGDGRYYYPSYLSAPAASVDETVSDCPSSLQSRDVNQYGVDFIEIDCRGDYRLSFEGPAEIPVIPTEAYSGDYAFWSNRGDESDMTLTRAFDFTDVTGPITMDYRLWYEIEDGWDFVYLVGSTDGGKTWEMVRTPSGTDKDPFGNSYGWGYTGNSGGGERGEWIEESVDLSQFAGEEVLLRFEYVTDQAVNGEGLMVDDLKVDAAGYQADFEADNGGWEPAGFVRLYNRLPQTFRLALVEFGDQVRVTEIPLEGGRRGAIDLSVGDAVDRAVLVVMGATRHTWQPAEYQFALEAR
ncbi:MAG: immune inhibitor A, partial [Anaerolineales bacterium]|nr:immune inhibitor A [Anaerolineales bacterium]